MERAGDGRPVETRGRILGLLCSADRTAGELAGELGISANGVRGHLVQMEAEGLVSHRVVRRGVGKPAHEYHLTAAGSMRLSRAYLPLLSGLLTAVVERDGTVGAEALLRQVGRALARDLPPPGGDLRARAGAAAAALADLGGVCELRADGGSVRIEGACCPLRALVPDHPLACKAVEEMVATLVGAPVSEECEKGSPPGCRLVVGQAVRS